MDILKFLQDRDAVADQASPSGAPPNVKDYLFLRRPDLGEIELTCENSNTVLPYVDLVLEILEDAVAPPPDFTELELDASRIPELDAAQVSAELRTAFGNVLSEDASVRVKRAGEWWVVDDLNFSYRIRREAAGAALVATRGRQTGRSRRSSPRIRNMSTAKRTPRSKERYSRGARRSIRASKKLAPTWAA